MIAGHRRVERVLLEGASAAHPRRDDVLAAGIEAGQLVGLAEVGGRVYVLGAKALVVVLDYAVEEVGEGRVGLRVAGVDADARVRMLQARLYDVQERRAEARSFAGLEERKMMKKSDGCDWRCWVYAPRARENGSGDWPSREMASSFAFS